MLQLLPPIGFVSLYCDRAANNTGGALSGLLALSAAGGPADDMLASVSGSIPFCALDG